ncbi:divergent polysaccharide deacetylase family protein [Ferrovibrio sp.]|uniref:divergent polysaccharide deacetylase family protein n=1 Tax=Ferrovibrio sp. TaxID=1917215 RepID=UPI002619D9FD|nr:divergent polysaccharide deacetylase family protein [Ferrovibrio sp.]
MAATRCTPRLPGLPQSFNRVQMSDPATTPPLRLKPRRAATAQSAAGAYGAVQAQAAPGHVMPAQSPTATGAPKGTLAKNRGFVAVNWPLMTAAAALLAGGIAVGMAVGQAPASKPAMAAVAPLPGTVPAANSSAAPSGPVAAVPAQGWRPVSDLARVAVAPPPPPILPPTEPPAIVNPAPAEAPIAVVVAPAEPAKPPVSAPAPVAPVAAKPEVVKSSRPATDTPVAVNRIGPRSADPAVQLAAAVPPPAMAPRAAGNLHAWRVRAVPPPSGAKPPYVAIIIDDAGLDRRGTQRATKLPEPITLSFMSYAADLSEQAAAARAAGHEVMLHLPMEPLDIKRHNPGPNALYVNLDEAELQRRLDWHLDRFSGYVGVNNHMGSRFTANAARMTQVMESLGRRQVFWLDSLSGPSSAGPTLARQRGLDAAERDIFLDDDRSPGIGHELAAMERIARARGDVIAIGHPHATTLSALESWIASARAKGFSLVPVSTVLLRRQQQER